MSGTNSWSNYAAYSSRRPLQGDIIDHAGRATTEGFFHNAHHFLLQSPTMVDQITHNHYYSNEAAIGRLATYTIRGAEFDSSARDPPPRCHPNTRSGILQRVGDWLNNDGQGKRILWLSGPAGVGKSAIIQTLAESTFESDSSNSRLGATLFFSKPNDRDNPHLVFTTIAYQLAIRYPAYREFICRESAIDPTLMEKSLTEQFRRLIAKPFGEQNMSQATGPLTIFLDGLDECKGERQQGEIATLIGRFVVKFPSVPLLWVISSRPEPHLKAVFSRELFQQNCWEENIPVDSDEACVDVERYLRKMFEEIRQNYSTSFSPTSQWPSETEFLKISTSASGLFAFAATVIRFIDDLERGNPVSQLHQVLAVIEKARQSTKGQERFVNPFATLDALYSSILSTIPKDVLPTTARILGQVSFHHPTFASLSNFLGLTQHDAYGALQRLHSVISVPPPELAHTQRMVVYHASFFEYLNDDTRSGEFRVNELDGFDCHLECDTRILGEANNTGPLSNVDIANVVLSWPVHDASALKMELYQRALARLPQDFRGASEAGRRQRLGEIVQIMRNLDPGELALPNVNFTVLLLGIQQTTIFQELVGRQIAQFTSIGALDPLRINKEKLAHTYYEQIGDIPVKDWRGFDFVYDYSYYVKEESGTFRQHALHHAMAPLSSETMGQVLVDLDHVRADSPDATVMIFGIGTKSIVMFERELIPDVQIWRYIIPYNSL